MNRKEIDNYCEQEFGRKVPSSTLSKWIKENRIKAIKLENGTYDYDFESFQQVVNSPEYQTKIKAKKTKPQDCIGKIKGELLIKSIVPKEEREDKGYGGTIMYCDCLACGKKNVQVRFSYLTDNGNYHQESCGCLRKERVFLASARKDLTSEHLKVFRGDFEKFLFVHKILKANTDKYYTDCPIEEYLKAITTLYNDFQFNAIYKFWQSQMEEKKTTYYDWAKPSLDHIIPRSRGGSHQIDNLQILTVFENLAKRDMTWDEWQNFKKITNTCSDYYVENILKKIRGGKDNEPV